MLLNKSFLKSFWCDMNYFVDVISIRVLILISVTVLTFGCSNADRNGYVRSNVCKDIGACAESIHNAVTLNWRNPFSTTANLNVVLSVSLDDEFNISNLVVLESSGSQEFDKSAIMAVNSSSPFVELRGLHKEIYEKSFRKFKFQFSPSNSLSDSDIYSDAKKMIKDGDYINAKKNLYYLLSHNRNHVYEQYAKYWLGEIYMAENNLQEAKKHFESIVEDQKGEKVSASLYKLAIIEKKNGNEKLAKAYTQDILENYPDSLEARYIQKLENN